MSLVELKAKAYDILAQIEYLQRELAAVNSKISTFSKVDDKNESGNEA